MALSSFREEAPSPTPLASNQIGIDSMMVIYHTMEDKDIMVVTTTIRAMQVTKIIHIVITEALDTTVSRTDRQVMFQRARRMNIFTTSRRVRK